jgi:hypothetical protein
MIQGNPVERVEADRMFEIRRIEIEDVVRALGRNGIDERCGEIAVRIEEPEAAARVQVREHERKEQGALPGAGLAENVDVTAAIAQRERDRSGKVQSSRCGP